MKTIKQIIFEPLEAGCGYEHATAFDWAMALPKEKRQSALIKLFGFDRAITSAMNIWMLQEK